MLANWCSGKSTAKRNFCLNSWFSWWPFENLHFFPPPLYGLIKSRGLNLWDLPKDFRKYHCPKTVASVSNADLWHLEMFAWIVMQLMGRVVKRRGIYINEKWKMKTMKSMKSLKDGRAGERHFSTQRTRSDTEFHRDILKVQLLLGINGFFKFNIWVENLLAC